MDLSEKKKNTRSFYKPSRNVFMSIRISSAINRKRVKKMLIML